MLVAKTSLERNTVAWHAAPVSGGRRRANAPNTRPNRRLAAGYVAVLAVTLAAALLYMALHAGIVQARQQVSDLEKTLAELQKECDGLEVQIAELSSVERIENVARGQLNMRESGTAVVVAALPPDDGPAPSAPVRPAQVGQEGRETVLARLGRWISSIGYAQASTGEP